MSVYLRKLFEKFHQKNPWVYRKFHELGFKMSTRRSHYSAYGLWHTMRYFYDFEYTDPAYKINDHHVAYYTRLFMDDHPELEKHEDGGGKGRDLAFLERRKLKGGGEERIDPDTYPDDPLLWPEHPSNNGKPPDDDDPEEGPKQGWLI